MATKICTDDKVINPKTNRCVLKTGKIGREVLKETKEAKKAKDTKTNPKICTDDKVLNPKTNRCVLKTSKIGRELLKEAKEAKKSNNTKKVPKATQMKYEWLMNVLFYHKDTHTINAKFRGDEFNNKEITNICQIMNFTNSEFKKRLPSDLGVTHRTTYSPGKLRFSVTPSRPLTDDEVQNIEHIIGSNLGMSLYYLNRILTRLDVDIYPDWDKAVLKKSLKS